MNRRTAVLMMAIGVGSLVMAGCASTPVATDAAAPGVFQAPVERVQKAAVDALSVTGFEVQKQEPTYVEGFRPRKVGLFVGSGGETVGVWLTAQGPNATEVRVDTAKSVVGILGQKNWDVEVLDEMRKSLAL